MEDIGSHSEKKEEKKWKKMIRDEKEEEKKTGKKIRKLLT
jgi:hypothetical protein